MRTKSKRATGPNADKLKTVRVPRGYGGLHIEAPGCIINVQTSGLSGPNGEPMTHVSVNADGDRYAGDTPWWAIPGAVVDSRGVGLRIIETDAGEPKAPGTGAADGPLNPAKDSPGMFTRAQVFEAVNAAVAVVDSRPSNRVNRTGKFGSFLDLFTAALSGELRHYVTARELAKAEKNVGKPLSGVAS